MTANQHSTATQFFADWIDRIDLFQSDEQALAFCRMLLTKIQNSFCETDLQELVLNAAIDRILKSDNQMIHWRVEQLNQLRELSPALAPKACHRLVTEAKKLCAELKSRGNAAHRSTALAVERQMDELNHLLDIEATPIVQLTQQPPNQFSDALLQAEKKLKDPNGPNEGLDRDRYEAAIISDIQKAWKAL